MARTGLGPRAASNRDPTCSLNTLFYSRTCNGIDGGQCWTPIYSLTPTRHSALFANCCSNAALQRDGIGLQPSKRGDGCRKPFVNVPCRLCRGECAFCGIVSLP